MRRSEKGMEGWRYGEIAHLPTLGQSRPRGRMREASLIRWSHSNQPSAHTIRAMGKGEGWVVIRYRVCHVSPRAMGKGEVRVIIRYRASHVSPGAMGKGEGRVERTRVALKVDEHVLVARASDGGVQSGRRSESRVVRVRLDVELGRALRVV